MAKFKGIMVPITTPYDKSGNILWDEFENHIEVLLAAGVHSVLAPSGTGEFANLPMGTRVELTAHAAKAIAGRIPLVAMISDCSTANVLELARRSKAVGATEVMLTPPFFSHINQRAIKAFFLEIADKIDLPLWIYHQPGETKLTVSLEVLAELAKHPNIVGVKIAPAEDFMYFTKAVRLLKDNENFSVLNGEDFDLLASLLIGGDGGVSSLGNVIPREVVELFCAAERGDWATAQAKHEMVMRAFDTAVDVVTGNYQSAVKTVLMAQGLYSTNVVSSPFLTILPEEQEAVIARARASGIIK